MKNKNKSAEYANISADENTTSVKNDPVNHPSHYTSGKIEVIDFIEDQKLNMHLGNAVKYISRAGKKDKSKTVEDLRKAVWYIERYIGVLEKTENERAGNRADNRADNSDYLEFADIADIADFVDAEKGDIFDNPKKRKVQPPEKLAYAHFGDNRKSVSTENRDNRDSADNTATSLSEHFINTEIFIDFGSELLYGEDEAYVSYPVRFATVRFQLMPTRGLIELIDRRRYKLGYEPMYPLDTEGQNMGQYRGVCEGAYNGASTEGRCNGGSNGSGTEGCCEALDNCGWYDFFISLNGYTNSRLDTCIAAVVAGSDSPDNEEMYTIDLSETEQELLYNRFDEQCRKYVGKGCEELLAEAEELMGE